MLLLSQTAVASLQTNPIKANMLCWKSLYVPSRTSTTADSVLISVFETMKINETIRNNFPSIYVINMQGQ